MVGSEIFNEVLTFMGNYHMLRDKLEIDSQFHDKTIELLHDRIKSDCSEISILDGIKGKIDEDNWILVRKSNTEDVIRVSAESNDFEKCKKILQHTKELVKQSYEQVK